MEDILISGSPVYLGVLVSWIAEAAKASNLLPFIQKGKPWQIRIFVALAAVVTQIAFAFVTKHAIDWSALPDAFINYVVASAAYIHIFKSE